MTSLMNLLSKTHERLHGTRPAATNNAQRIVMLLEAANTRLDRRDAAAIGSREWLAASQNANALYEQAVELAIALGTEHSA